jgi:hypothetical protein
MLRSTANKHQLYAANSRTVLCLAGVTRIIGLSLFKDDENKLVANVGSNCLHPIRHKYLELPLLFGLRQGFDSRQRQGNLLCSTTFRSALEPIRPSSRVQSAPVAIFLRVKRPGRKADNSLPSTRSTEAKNGGALLPIHCTSSWLNKITTNKLRGFSQRGSYTD